MFESQSPLTPMTALTADNCFDSPAFCAWWDAVDAIHCHCWDDGDMLHILVDLYNNQTSIVDAADQALEAYEIGMAEYYMGIPSWA